MPELPDVEGFRRYFARHAQGQRILRIEAPDRMMLRNRTPRSFAAALTGATFGEPRRHCKWLFAPAGDPELLIHFGMTGLLHWSEGSEGRHPHDRVVFICERGELRYNNMRRFGGVWLARGGREQAGVTGPLGPDAAALQREEFERLLRSRRGGIKAALMDQRLLAGIGNLLSDEILWRARVHPSRPVPSLDRRRTRRLYEALRAAVGESMRYGRVPHGTRWLTRVRDDRDPTRPRCGTRLRKATVAGRTACWCPREQR